MVEREPKQYKEPREDIIQMFISKKEWQDVDPKLRKEIREKLTEEEIQQRIKLLGEKIKNHPGGLWKEWSKLTEEELREVVIRDLILDKAID